MTDAIVITGLKNDPFEYFCRDCHQLRLCCLGTLEKCGGCGAAPERCIIGEVGSLDKEALIAKEVEHE